MEASPAACTVSTAPLAPPAPALPRAPGGFSALRGMRALARWWDACWQRLSAIGAALVPRVPILEVNALSPHQQRDLHLHDNADSGVQAQMAWQQYERYRDSRSWRTPL